MPRTLLLCFIHGFKGDDDTFRSFPDDLKRIVAAGLPDNRVESVVYPKYETKGELSQSTQVFVEWLKERVMELRKDQLERPWPPHDREVGVILVAHSMGGFVAADSLFRILDDRRANNVPQSTPLFPPIQGILAFDTPYNGLARSMFVYGAFSNYQKVSSVFNVMTALSAAAPATLSRMGLKRGAASAARPSSTSNPAWKTWQLVAVRTGTVGAIAAGGVAAYIHRNQIMQGVRNVRSLKKEDVVQGYHHGVDALGQGLAYINRGNVGRSFAWMSDHFTFVGALMKPSELGSRLARMAALKGVGIHDLYASLGENGYWSGGHFVPERTFCAVPGKEDTAYLLFERHVMANLEDEVQAHMSLFKPDKNEAYEKMTQDAARRVIMWFNDETELFDDPKIATPPVQEAQGDEVDKAVEAAEKVTESKSVVGDAVTGEGSDDVDLPDESPIDVAAAASLVPLPDDDDDAPIGDGGGDPHEDKEKQTYMRHLFRIAQQTGTGIKTWWPSKLPSVPVDQISRANVSLPNMPKVGLPNVSMPTVNLFSKKSAAPEKGATETETARSEKPPGELEGVGEKAEECQVQRTEDGGP